MIFNESEFSCKEAETSEVSASKKVEVDVNQNEVNSDDESRHSERQRRPPVRFGYDEYADTVTLEHRVHHVAYNASHIVEPKTLKEALESDHAEEWKSAADSEYKSLMENET